jgi:ribonuclease III
MDLDKLQSALNYQFNDPYLLRQALVHRSYLNERDRDPNIKQHNERLEFLGDAVLELVVTDYLYTQIQQDEGVLTALRAALVNYKTMGEVGMRIGLNEQILLSRGEREDTGRARLTLIANCMEAIIGAIYLDGSLDDCQKFISSYILVLLPEILSTKSYKDFKTLLQEYCQKQLKVTPHYRVVSSLGKDHEKVFNIGVWIGRQEVARGVGRSKQEAETEAARLALESFKTKNSQNSVIDSESPIDE